VSSEIGYPSLAEDIELYGDLYGIAFGRDTGYLSVPDAPCRFSEQSSTCSDGLG
jgi:hypothetical protein